MKKYLFTIAIIGFFSTLNAQEAADKKVQAGLVLGSGVNFQKMQTKNMDANGLGWDWTVGMNTVFNFSETIGLNTGIEFDFNSLKYAPSVESGGVYYLYKDLDILEYRDGIQDASAQLFQLKERFQKSVYLTIPTMLTFRTGFFGYWRYFGRFGLRNSFLLTSKVDDEGFVNGDETAGLRLNEGFTSKNDLFFFKSAVGISAGAEWNFSGSTSLIAELGYYYGITPLHTQKNTDAGKEKNSLYTIDDTFTPVMFNNKSTQNQIMLKVSILF
jgi:hypothetical protein